MCETSPCEMNPGQSHRPLENHMSSLKTSKHLNKEFSKTKQKSTFYVTLIILRNVLLKMLCFKTSASQQCLSVL